MFLKNKWRGLNIKKKFFLETTALLIVAFTLIYLVVYLVLPKVYEAYKKIVSNKSIDKVVQILENDPTVDTQEVLNTFVYASNLKVFLLNEKDMIVYPIKKEGKDGYNIFDENIAIRNTLNIAIDITKDVHVKSLGKSYKMLVHIPMDIAGDTSIVIIYFIPIFIIFSVVIATIMSIIYSRALSNPLIHINNVAKNMAKLDFSENFEINGSDELNQLCESLNDMSFSLNDTIIKLEEANKSLRDDIEKQNLYDKQRRDFIATISHELKSPITIISGQLEGMICNIGAYKNRDKYLNKSYAVTQEMKSLVEELLQLSKFEKHGFEIVKTKVNISKVISEILVEQSFFIGEKSLKIDFKGDFSVNVDMSLIKKALNNLINNSVKYSPNGEEIKIRLISSGEPTIIIENFGVTIDKNDLKEIFTAFYRVDKSRNRNTGGSGLGLYIVKTILDAHGNIDYSVASTDNSVRFTLIFK